RPAGGDVTLGAATAALLYAGAMAMHVTVLPRGTAREAWLFRVYLQIGDPEAAGAMSIGGAIFLVAALEEIAWRGLVMHALSGWLGARRAWLLSAALYAGVHLPTLWLLGDPVAGWNPLVAAAALAGGIAWGYLVNRTGRLVPAIFSHALFTWAIV